MARPTTADDDLLVRAIQVLEALAGMRQPASLAAVVERFGHHQSQVYRSLRALQDSGYVEHVGRQGYRIAARAVSLGALLSSRPELRELARPILVRLAATTSATVAFHLRSGHHRVLVLAAVPPRHRAPDAPGPDVTLGERAPLTRGCAGRAILAHVPGEPPDEPGASRLGTELERIRRDGYALSFADNHRGQHGISVPLLDLDTARPLGSLTVSGDADRFDEAALLRLLGPLRAAAAELTPQVAGTLGPQASRSQPPLDVATPP